MRTRRDKVILELLTILILVIVCWINHHWWVGGARHWLLGFCLDDASELGVGCGGGSWWGSGLLVRLFHILAWVWENYIDCHCHLSYVDVRLNTLQFLVCLCKQSALTFIRWDNHAINVAGLFMKEGTVWLLAASCLVLPITRYLLSVFLF